MKEKIGTIFTAIGTVIGILLLIGFLVWRYPLKIKCKNKECQCWGILNNPLPCEEKRVP